MPRNTLTQKQETLPPGPLTNARWEIFAQNWLLGKPATECAIIAGYSQRRAASTASRLVRNRNILARYNELQQQVADAKVGTVRERAERLTEMYRARLTDFVDDEGNVVLTAANNGALAEVTIEEWQSVGDLSRKRIKRVKLLNPVSAIAEHNKMDGVYQSDTVINDNRTININVDKVLIDARDKLTSVITGLAARLGEGGGVGETD